MSNFNLTVDLMKFWGSRVITTKSGEEVVVIPIECNHFTRAKNGGVIANLQATEKKTPSQYGDTHYIKPRFKKDVYASLTDEQRNSIPFVGAVYAQQNNYGANGNNNGQYAPQNAYTPSVAATDIDDSIF